MRLVWGFAVSVCILAGASEAAEWRTQRIDTPARVMAIETVDGKVEVNAGGLWYRIVSTDGQVKLTFVDRPTEIEHPKGALSNARIVTGSRDIARAWLADPTARYDHGIFDDLVDAGSLIIEGRNGKLNRVALGDDAVFEDREPRLADLDGDGRDEIIVVKSYLKHGSSLAVLAARNNKYDVVAETPPLGAAHRWLNPAGIADFNGDGKMDIALVRMPHAVGTLELWTWAERRLRKITEFPDVANHVAGSHALDMSATADFDGDGVADLAIPSFDRNRLRIVAFAPKPREIASIALPAKALTNIALIADGAGPPAIAIGLSDGTLTVLRRD